VNNRIIILLISFCSSFAYGQVKSIQERLGYPKNAKLLIIHADDLGLSHSENSASIAAMEKGCVSSASIMVPCPWFSEIAAYAQSNSKDLGLHLTLTSEWKYYKWGPVTQISKVPGLVNKNGFFYSSVDSVLQNAKSAEVEEEIRNQVKRAIQFGFQPTHLDAHMGTVLHQLDFLRAYIKTGHEFRIPVFIPRQLEALLKIKLDTLISDKDVIVDYILSASPEDFKKGMKNFYTNGIKNIKSGLTYLIIHTAYDDDEMKAITVDHPDWGSSWRQHDFDFFSSSECAMLLKKNNIYVITWKEIRDKITRK
jgi:hypothetical protein